MKDINKVKFKEGIDKYKFLADFEQENSQAVWDLFEQHGYQLELDGTSAKVFAVPTKAVYYDANRRPELTISTLAESLDRIKQFGLKDVYTQNISLATLQPDFVSKVKWSKDNNFPFLREDQTFISELYNDNLFAEYTAHKPMETIKTAQEVDAIERDAKNSEVVADKMDAEDRQVYNQIVESLNYLILQNPTNEYLPTIVNNITKRVVDAILRKEYRFLPLGDVVAGVMFEGIDVTPEMESVRELVLSAFPEEREMNEGRGLA